MSDVLSKLWDSLIPVKEQEAPKKGALERLWDNLTESIQNRPSQSPSKQQSGGEVGAGINKQGKSLQGSKNGLGGQMTFDDVFNNLVSAESGGKHLDERGKLIKSKVGAEGITQLMPHTAKRPGFGVKPAKDKSEKEYLRVGKEYLQALHKKFEGDWEKALAAYNAGVGNVMKAIGKAERFGGDWKEHLPKKEETLPYIEKVLKKDKPQTPDYGNRPDGTKKGKGFLGELKLPDGGVATEWSVGITIGDKDVEIPTLVPTLSKEEVDQMVNDIIPNRKQLPKSIIDKAAAHAKKRIAEGKSPFLQADE